MTPEEQARLAHIRYARSDGPGLHQVLVDAIREAEKRGMLRAAEVARANADEISENAPNESMDVKMLMQAQAKCLRTFAEAITQEAGDDNIGSVDVTAKAADEAESR